MKGEYDRGERKKLRSDVREVLIGCSVVVAAVILLFIVYGVWLVLSGWKG